MFHQFTKLLTSVLATIVVVGVASALSVVVPMKLKAGGTVSTVVPGHLSFAAQGNATHFGHYSEVGSADFDAVGNVFNGELTQTTANGSTITGEFSGTYTPLATGQIRFNLHVTYLVGTGHLEDVTGEYDLVAFLSGGLAPGSPFQLEALGSLVFP